MNRDNIVFTICGLILGLLFGGFFIGPWVLARSNNVEPRVAAQSAPPAMESGSPSSEGAATMQAVMQQIQQFRTALEKDPNNFGALVQLGNFYMDAAKYSEAIDFYERALKVRRDPAVEIDLGISYRSSGSPEKALELFRRIRASEPANYYATFNEAIALADLGKFNEAQALLPLLKQQRPDDPDLAQFEKALGGVR